MPSFILNSPEIQRNRVVYSWRPKGPFKESFYWVEYPGVSEIPPGRRVAEGYFPACVALASLGDVSIKLPVCMGPRVLQDWKHYIDAVSRTCLKKKTDIVFENGEEPPISEVAQGTKKALLFGGGTESLLVLSRLLQEKERPILVSVGGPRWAGSDPDKNPAKSEMDQKVCRDLGLELAVIRTNFREVVSDADWDSRMKPRHSITNAALLNPFMISSFAPVAGFYGAGKLLQGNEKMTGVSEYFCFSSEGTRLLRGASSAFIFEALLQDAYKEAVCNELYRNYPDMVRYQYSCWRNEGSRWCHRCETCARYFFMMEYSGVDPRIAGLDAAKIKQNSKALVRAVSTSEESFPGETWDRLYPKIRTLRDPVLKKMLYRIRGAAWMYHHLYEPFPESVRRLARISRFIPWIAK